MTLSLKNSNVYIIPALRVATVVAESHAAWLSTPGAKGQQRNDSKFRRSKNSYGMSLKSAPEAGWMNILRSGMCLCLRELSSLEL